MNMQDHSPQTTIGRVTHLVWCAVLGCGAPAGGTGDSAQGSGVGTSPTTTATGSTGAADTGATTGAEMTVTVTDSAAASSTLTDSDSGEVEGLLFEEDFDDAPDWTSTRVGTCANAGANCETNVPAPWSLLYLDQPSVAELGPTCQISAEGAIGGSGKGLRFIDDARGRANAWKADCQLIKYLGEVYPELYFSFDILWNPEMTMEDFNAAKVFRAGYYLPGYFDGSISSSVFSTTDSTRGLVFIDLQRAGSAPDYDASFKAVYRCNPGYRTDCRGPSQVAIGGWNSRLGAGQAHSVIFRMQINTGLEADGVFQAWWDGELVIDDLDVQWTTDGANLGGFNAFSVGGNQDHNWGCGPGFPDDEMCNDESQQWKHNIDNVRAGTTWASVQ